MKIFIDSDVILDLLLGRENFVKDAKSIFQLHSAPNIKLYTSPIIISNVVYVITRIKNSKAAKQKIRKLLNILNVLNIGEAEILESLNSKFKDFEDGLQNYCATNSKMNLIVTRNVKDYKHSDISILTPQELLVKLSK